MAFDLLYRDGRDLTARPLRDRRARLEDVVASSGLVFPVRRLAPDGLLAWTQVVERGYEGLVAKDEASVYEGGPTRSCLKVKRRIGRTPRMAGGGSAWRRRLVDRPDGSRTSDRLTPVRPDAIVGGPGNWLADLATGHREVVMHGTATLHWILRVAVAACFIGHGAFGIITKAAWVPYFAIFGIPEAWAWRLMPVVGTVDIAVGVLTLFQPVRAVLLYMAFWGLQTASLRPLAGQGVWELFERAGNYGVPLAFLVLLGAGRYFADWFSARPAPPLTEARASAIGWILRVTTALLLIGHGGFDVAMQKDWSGYAAAIGISPAALAAHPLRPVGGWFECALGLLVLAWPARGLLLFVFVWKLGTEALRPLAGEPIWEFIERGGSYGAPLALAWLRGWRRPWPSEPASAGAEPEASHQASTGPAPIAR